MNSKSKELAKRLFENAHIEQYDVHLEFLEKWHSRNESMLWAQQITREAVYNIYVGKHTYTWSPSKIWRVAYLLATRYIRSWYPITDITQNDNHMNTDEMADGEEW